ncbi:ATP-binding cassette domain-containing protein [Photobacterium minamisatsumaniensis]|uniref:ATP-binding cassette domain-containing protein n=1 Tax=Photobacterium minamisatsumaniensis TaxID=2910233 RepID=UPI003D0F0CE3
MPAIYTHKLSFQLDTGEWLFRDLDLSLNCRITGLVGRNGAGKSVLFSLLLGDIHPSQGSVSSQGKIAAYSQLPSVLLDSNQRIADFLGINDKILALRAIEQGSCEQAHFDVVGEDWEIETRTLDTLKALKIESNLNTYCHTLSGGQLALLQLHQLFESDADILLLDEPSNHLDAGGRQWLIERLQRFEGKILLISHDRTLLRHVDGIYQLTSLGLRFYSGNYDAFSEQSSIQSYALDKQILHFKSEQKRLERQAQANKEKAQQREAHGNRIRKSGSQPKILMDAMKEKAGQSRAAAVINQMNQLERNQEKLQVLKQQKETLKPQAMYLQQSSCVKKRTLLKVEDCRLKYGSGKALSFSLSQAERGYLSGGNGCGKSTLLKAIQGAGSNYTGVIKLHTDTVYLDQHFGLLELNETMLVSLMNNCEGLAESDARTLLAGIGFRRDSVYRKVAHLSGGEKMKLSMLMISHVANSPLLLLDEPDNHLDIESKQILATVLRDYKGAFILVSHDQDFIAEVGVNKSIIMG